MARPRLGGRRYSVLLPPDVEAECRRLSRAVRMSVSWSSFLAHLVALGAREKKRELERVAGP